MRISEASVRHPVTVTVGVILLLLSGVVALRRLPIQLTPDVDEPIISVTTTWEGASPQEIELEIIDEQEEMLQGVSGLRQMTSVSSQGQGSIRLEFPVGINKHTALREVSDRLRQVPEYPEGVDQPVVAESDPMNRDYIAWIVLGQEIGGEVVGDEGFDIRTLHDFAEDRIESRLERVPGISEINILGGREREVQVRFDAVRLAQHGLTVPQLIAALRATNRNVSAGFLPDGKSDVAVRAIGQFESVDDVLDVAVADTEAGPIYVRDVASVVETYKEPVSFVRSRGRSVIAINAQKEIGTNVIQVMGDLQAAIDELNAPGGALDLETRRLSLASPLRLTLVYDQTVYIDDAIALVRDNIWQGGVLATLVLLLFLRSIRSVVIIGTAIPISVVGTVIAMIALGRTINVVSLAGMAFAIGMLVDNSIVVLENIYRHLEMGKSPRQAAIDGGQEVWGAVLGSTLTTVVVFVPILLIQEEVGQLFRDIAIALCVSVTLSLLVSISVVPAAAALFLKPSSAVRSPGVVGRMFGRIPLAVARAIFVVTRSRLACVGIVLAFTALSVVGSVLLMPRADYLPRGNRNLVFGMLISPPGYNEAQQTRMAERVEETIRPFWEASRLEKGSPEREAAERNLPRIPVVPWMAWRKGEHVVPAPIDNYFFVGFGSIMFHGAVSESGERASDNEELLTYATRPEVLPGTFGFAFQLPLFRVGGNTGAAVRVEFRGDDLAAVNSSAGAAFGRFMGEFGPGSVQPDPPNFNVLGPELRIIPDQRRLAEAGLTPQDLATTVLASGDGSFVGDYRLAGRSIDLKVISAEAAARRGEEGMGDLSSLPVATPHGLTMSVGQLARVERVSAAGQINHVDRQRAVSLQVTPPPTVALETAVESIEGALASLREAGAIPPSVHTQVAGSASRLAEVRAAMLGDGTLWGLLGSAMFLALVVCYLVMVVLFQSFITPFVILFSVPVACVGGFAALFGVVIWSLMNPYMPMQSLDVLTMLGFVILIGVVVNNAILIVHQAINFRRGTGDETPTDLAFRGMRDAPEVRRGAGLPLRAAIAESVRTRVRPIMMSSLTSVVGLSPLILVPGPGSELYRGLGAVVAGGLLVSTIFTIVLVPLLYAAVSRDRPLADQDA